MAICAPAKHSFHPKFWLMVGDERIALLVGSGNLTQSGFMDNSELFDVVQVFAGGSDKLLVDDIRAFLRGLRSLWTGSESRRLLAIDTLDQIDQELERFASSLHEDPEPRFRLLNNFSSPIVEQFKEFFNGGIVQVAAPYFGGSIEGVRLCVKQTFSNKHSGVSRSSLRRKGRRANFPTQIYEWRQRP